MSAPYVGKRVQVVGTSRDELNGSIGTAFEYDRDKGRYTVRLDSGQSVALKPAHLQESTEPARKADTGSAGSAAMSSSNGGVNWQQVMMVVLGAAFVFNLFREQFSGTDGASGGSNLWGHDEGDYDYKDEGYLPGQVREVATLDQLRGALAHHSDNTGLPVIVDFFSHSCGPCRMIAPVFKRVALEFKAQAVFLKVDVNRNYEAASACHVRGMPTFQFYLNKKQVSQFSGADERALRSSTASLAEQAEEAGTYVGKHVSRAALKSFYEAHDPAKVNESSKLADKYADKTAQLMRVCQKKYSAMPKLSKRQIDSGPTSSSVSTGKTKQQVREKAITDYSMEDLEAEVQRRRAEGYKKEETEDDFPFESAAGVVGPDVYKVVIIGGGPAGLSAATYTARAGLRPLVVAPAFGGQLLGKGVDVENYPGVVGEHATGRGLVELMRRQANSFEARFVDTAVLGVDFEKQPFRVRVNGTSGEILAQTVILACGAESRWLQVGGEQDFRGRGVSACATCDGFLYRSKDVIVVGGGDHAMEDALHLARTCRQVTLVHRRDRFRASKVLADRVLGHTSIKIQWNTSVDSFQGNGQGLTHVMLRSTSGVQKLKTDGAFIAIGHDPQTAFLKGQIEMDEAGYVALRSATATFVPGVFAAGDIADHTYRQAATAAGTGVMAALDAEKFLNQH